MLGYHRLGSVRYRGGWGTNGTGGGGGGGTDRMRSGSDPLNLSSSVPETKEQPNALTYSQLEEYLKLSAPLQSLPSNKMAASKMATESKMATDSKMAPCKPQTNHNQVVKETKRLLEEIKKLQEEKEREEDKENNRNRGNGGGRKQNGGGGGGFPMTVYQETYQKHGGGKTKKSTVEHLIDTLFLNDSADNAKKLYKCTSKSQNLFTFELTYFVELYFQKENEEQKVFELLEQKTKDASFSSTSSMVAKLMEESVRSTPVKRHPATLAQEPPTTEHGSSSGRTDKGSHVRFTDANLYRTIEEVDESVQTSGEVYECGDSSIDSTRLDDPRGFTIQPLPSHVHTERDIECECDSSSDTQYSSSEDEGEQTPSVDEAIKSYKPVLNRPYVDSGKAKVKSKGTKHQRAETYWNDFPALATSLSPSLVSIDFKTLYPDAKNIEEVLPSLRPKLFELLRGKKSRDELIPQIKLLEVDNSEDRQNLGALLAIVNLLNVTNYRTKFGNDVFYQPIVDELNFLSETGIFLDTKCYTGQVYFALALTLSDNLGHAQTLSLSRAPQNGNDMFNFSSPSMRLKPPDNLNIKSDILNLDNGIHMIDEMHQNGQTYQDGQTHQDGHTPEDGLPEDRPKAKKPFLRRGEGLTRFRMTLNDFKKPVPKPTFVRSRFQKKPGLKSFGADNPDPNPFEYHSETAHSLELLKKRLGDLENEIHVFRLENIKLNKERKEFEKDRAAFTRSKKNAEKAFQEEKDAFTREMDEERSKLNREKKVFLKYAKDAKNFPSKQEREDLSRLKAELQGSKEDAVKKETKWAASQARLRNHIKVLEGQNTELKVQVEKLTKEAKKVSFSSKKHISNTQIMNAINSQISKLTKSDLPPPNAKPPTSILKKTSHPSTTHNPNTHSISPSSQNTHSNSPSSNSNSSNQSNAPNFSLGSSHYSADSAPSSYNLRGGEKGEELMPEDSFDRVIYQSLLGGERVGERKEEEPSRDDDVIPIHTLNLGAPNTTSTNTTTASDAEYKEIITADGTRERHYTDGRQEIHYPNGNTVIVSEAGKYIKMFYYNGDIKETDTGDRTVRYFYSESNTWHTTMPDGTEVLEFANGQKERRLTDGRVEIEYTNGCRRVIGKDVSEAGKYIKMFYYNGDIKETDTGDRTVRYFYSESNTWHTTMPDGTEVLEFANGQKERRLTDGRVEIEYTNGCRRVIGKDGNEVWRFEDGPVETVEILGDQRILKLRNGQKEIHTREYKRREFPDGAVKLVYPDGIQETRYPNGRIRLKDDQGNLIMDSHEM
ncbi:uncharacterized protein LOC103510302 [Diaphorina citri]|uniref:Uncharacterized protein LOC103510302 n=1 Tax=Diaphorina citri TaxID=121845 RepID=A0A3Q0J0E7_DIACI|nr:uncharacterized protein LOC103510302 [Diaphorina citri]